MPHAPDFRLETSAEVGRTRIALAGELDGFGAEALTKAFERAAHAHECDELVLDLQNVSFIDSAGLRAVIEVERTARERNVPLVMTPTSPAVTELLRISGLNQRITLGPQAETPPAQEFAERAVLVLPADPTAPSRARAEVREAMRDLPDDELAVAALLASELVTNAVIHSGPAQDPKVRLLITIARDRLRIDVDDGGPGFDPQRPQPRRPDQGGRGLLLVDQLSSRWGAGPSAEDPARFSVWLELDLGCTAENRLH